MNTLITSVISGLIVAVVTSFLTVRLSLRRFYSERWWERKADAYTDIIEALHAKLEFLDSYFSVMHDGEKLSEADIDRLRAANREADQKINKLIRIGTFVISEEVATLLEYYQADQAKLKRDVYEADEGAWFGHEQKLTDRCLVKVRDAAMRDLKVSPWMSWEHVLEVISTTVRQRKKRDH